MEDPLSLSSTPPTRSLSFELVQIKSEPLGGLDNDDDDDLLLSSREDEDTAAEEEEPPQPKKSRKSTKRDKPSSSSSSDLSEPIATRQCALCQKFFATPRALQLHQDYVHLSAPVECEACGKTFKNQYLLRTHYRRTHPIDGSGVDSIELRRLKDRQRKQRSRDAARAAFLGLPTPTTVHDNEAEAETPPVSVTVKQEVPEPPVCDLCDDKRLFASFTSLKRHKQYVHKICEMQECKSCGAMVKNSEALRKHEVRHHSTPKIFPQNPPAAPPPPPSDPMLNFLKAKHADLSIPSCQLCGKEFATMKTLRGHLRLKHTEAPVNCTTCGKNFRNSAALRAHARQLHGIKVKELDQVQVPRDPATEERLRRQREQKQASRAKRRAEAALAAQAQQLESQQQQQSSSSIPNPAKRKYIPCIFCREKFCSRPELKSHELTIHSNDTSCPICSKVMPNYRRLKIHIMYHNLSSATSPIFCDHCGQSFVNKMTFKSHQRRLHHGLDGGSVKKIYNCTFPGCKMEFKYPDGLKHHARKHEPDDGTRFSCDFCEKSFRWKDHLNSHVHQRHNAQSELDEPFICPEPSCRKSFKYQQGYAHHLKIHGKEQTWYCQFCECSFNNPIVRRQHERLKHPPPPGGYPCYACVNNNGNSGGGELLRFKSAAILERHTSLIHPHLLRNQLEVVRKRPAAVVPDSIIPNLSDTNIGSSIQIDEPKVSTGVGGSFELEFNIFAESQDVFGQYNYSSIYNPNNNAVPEQGVVAAAVDPLSTNSTNNNTIIEQFDDDWFGGAFVDNFGSAPSPLSQEFCQVKLDLDRDRGGCDVKADVARQGIAAILKKDQLTLSSSSSSAALPAHLLLKKSEIDTAKWSTDPKLISATPLILCKQYIPIVGRDGRSYCEICCVNFMGGNLLAKHMKLFHEIDYVPPKGRRRVGVIRKRRSASKGDRCGSSRSRRRTKKYESSSEDEEELVEDDVTTEESTDEEEDANDDRLDTGMKTSNNDTSSKSEQKVIKTKIQELIEQVEDYKLKLEQSAKATSQVTKNVFGEPSEPLKIHAQDQSPINNIEILRTRTRTNAAPHTCNYCYKVFNAPHNLKQHILRIHQKPTIPNPSLTCPKCAKLFDHYRNLQRHIQKVHTVDPVPCEICGKILRNAPNLAEHKRHFHPKSKFQCKTCLARFSSYIGLRQHISHVHRKKRIMCDQCPYIAPYRQALINHVKVVHSTCHVVCPTCGKSFKSQMGLDIHARLHKTELDYKCLFCAAKFNTTGKKRRHEARFHGSGPIVRTNREIRDFHCRICNQLCRGSSKLEVHVIDVHSAEALEEYYYGPAANIETPDPTQTDPPALDPNDLIIISALDGANAASSTTLEIPLLDGNGEPEGASKSYYSKPVPCNICNVLCKNTACRIKHVNIAHPETLVRSCVDCGGEFKSPRHLLRHREVDHGLKSTGPITCEICGVVCSRRGYGLHYESHGLPTPCELCGKDYKNRKSLRDHLRTVHQGRKRPSVLLKHQGKRAPRVYVTPEMHQQQQEKKKLQPQPQPQAQAPRQEQEQQLQLHHQHHHHHQEQLQQQQQQQHLQHVEGFNVISIASTTTTTNNNNYNYHHNISGGSMG